MPVSELYILLNLIILYNIGILIVMYIYNNVAKQKAKEKQLVSFFVLLWFKERKETKQKQRKEQPANNWIKKGNTERKLCKDIA